jgi:hypothetical protein
MNKKLKGATANAVLTFCSVAITYVILEIAFFRLVLPSLPVAFRIYLPDRADFFLQTSKSHYVPSNYIALVGDSYAQGLGDWLISEGTKAAKPFHSADVIHAISGRDVSSFGRAASGSAEAMVLRVTRILRDEYCFLFPAIELPKRFLVYFYEGNDIDDNFKLVQHSIRPTAGDLRAEIDRYLDNQYGSITKWRCHGHLGDMIWKMVQFHARFGLNPDTTYNVGPVPPINHIVVDGRPANARELNVPSLALDNTQMEIGFAVYDSALAWLRRSYPQTPITIVYIPAPSTIYRFSNPDVVADEIYDPSVPQTIGHPHLSTGRRFPVADAYANSQKICQRIRMVSLAKSVGFVDTRSALRAAAAERALHGPRDWNHFNEAGYRLLGTLVAAHLDDLPADVCDDRWPAPSIP